MPSPTTTGFASVHLARPTITAAAAGAAGAGAADVTHVVTKRIKVYKEIEILSID
jgi:hypothetical protein